MQEHDGATEDAADDRPAASRLRGPNVAMYSDAKTAPMSRRELEPQELVLRVRALVLLFGLYSHSMVPGGLLVMSSTTRLTSRISLIIRDAICSSRSYGRRAQSAVIASSDVTARIATT